MANVGIDINSSGEQRRGGEEIADDSPTSGDSNRNSDRFTWIIALVMLFLGLFLHFAISNLHTLASSALLCPILLRPNFFNSSTRDYKSIAILSLATFLVIWFGFTRQEILANLFLGILTPLMIVYIKRTSDGTVSETCYQICFITIGLLVFLFGCAGCYLNGGWIFTLSLVFGPLIVAATYVRRNQGLAQNSTRNSLPLFIAFSLLNIIYFGYIASRVINMINLYYDYEAKYDTKDLFPNKKNN